MLIKTVTTNFKVLTENLPYHKPHKLTLCSYEVKVLTQRNTWIFMHIIFNSSNYFSNELR